MSLQQILSGKTRFIVTHRDPDIDDLEAIRLLVVHGREKFPGVEFADIVTSADRGSDLSAEELEETGTILVGIGGGRFDEHAFGDRPRLENESATTLVAKELEIFDRPELQTNMAYAHHLNHKADSREFDLALLAKLAFRHLTHTGEEELDEQMEREIFNFAFFLLNVAEENERSIISGEIPKGSVVRSMDEHIAIWLLETFRPSGRRVLDEFHKEATEKGKSVARIVANHLGKGDDKSLAQILDYARIHQKADTGRVETNFELAPLVELAQKHLCFGEGVKQYRRAIGKAVSLFLTAMWKKNINFHVACAKDFKSSGTRHLGNFNGIKAVSVFSANPEIAKYARSNYGGNYAIVVKREPSGNTQIFVDQRHKLDITPIVSAVRMAERQKRGYKNHLSTEVLTAQGNNVAGAGMWYFDGHQLMNGSLTTNQEPTKLSREEVEVVVGRALLKMSARKK